MSIKQILMNTEMVRALLAGRKTVTRRVVKPQPGEELAYIWGGSDHGKWGYSPYNKARYEEHREAKDWKYWTPPCHADDILYVRETWSKDAFGEYVYRTNYGTTEEDSFPPSMFKWRPSIHMPREAARIWLRVTDVHVERLQEITEEQAQAEGFRSGLINCPCSARACFCELWDSTIKPADREKYGWAANPFCWVISFERISKDEAMQ